MIGNSTIRTNYRNQLAEFLVTCRVSSLRYSKPYPNKTQDSKKNLKNNR